MFVRRKESTKKISIKETNENRIDEIRSDNVRIPLKIIDKVKHSICKISFERTKGLKNGTGFFIQLNDKKCIMTNYHVLKEDLIKKDIDIEIYNNNQVTIQLKEKYVQFFNLLDITTVRNG